MVYVRVTGRAIINVHSANAEGSVGNYMGLTKMFILRRREKGYEITEDIVISGNMIKHWHAVRVSELLKSQGYSALCENCKRYIMYRSSLNYGDEYDFIKTCAIEDLHGFLQPQKQVRRESIVKFAFMLPAEEMRAEYAAITHNRVFTEKTGTIPKGEQEMMVFKREYASGLYGFLSLMDLAYVGRPLADPDNPKKVLPVDERRLRAKCAVLALADILTGRFGAAASRAIPIIKTVELVCAVSKEPLPNLIHGFYSDYLEESARILKAAVDSGLVKNIKVFVYGNKTSDVFSKTLTQDLVESGDTVIEVLTKAAEVVEKWLE